MAVAILAFSYGAAPAQPVDCQRLRAQIAALDDAPIARPNRYAAAARKQRVELDRTTRYARALGCDQQQFLFFGGPTPARCPSLTAQIRQMEANLGQLQAAANQTDSAAVKQDLSARYNAYCRGPFQTAAQPAQRGFFETLFGIGGTSYEQGPVPPSVPLEPTPNVETEEGPRGGSQAVCVRSCDGGFFPLDQSARHADPSRLADLCQALCPNTTVSVFTKSPYKEIKTAVALDDGAPYTDLPNALKFQRSFDASCTCKAPRQSWVDALAGAEHLIGDERRGDILVTPEKAAELSRPRLGPKPRERLATPIPVQAAKSSAADPRGEDPAASTARAAPDPKQETDADQTKEIIGPDGIKRRVRIVGPTL